MNKIMTVIALLALTTACDSPRSQRSVLSTSTTSSSAVTSGTNLSTTGTVTSTTTSSSIPSDASHCSFSTDGVSGFESTSSHLGSYTLCQSSTDKTVFYAQFKTPPVSSSGDVNVCFIPHTTSGTNSIYVGNPMCGSFTNPKTVSKITFVKYDSYTNALINTVMFFKDTSYYYPMYGKSVATLDAYKDCMYRLNYGDSTYCSSFKSVGQYVLKNF
jgi:hypothetical protein